MPVADRKNEMPKGDVVGWLTLAALVLFAALTVFIYKGTDNWRTAALAAAVVTSGICGSLAFARTVPSIVARRREARGEGAEPEGQERIGFGSWLLMPAVAILGCWGVLGAVLGHGSERANNGTMAACCFAVVALAATGSITRAARAVSRALPQEARLKKITVLSLFIGLAGSFVGAISYSDGRSLKAHGVRTDAVVTGVTHSRGSGDTVFLRFTLPSERTATCSAQGFSDAPDSGENEPIIYDSTNPDNCVWADNTGYHTRSAIAFGGIGIVGLLVGSLTWIRNRPRRPKQVTFGYSSPTD